MTIKKYSYTDKVRRNVTTRTRSDHMVNISYVEQNAILDAGFPSPFFFNFNFFYFRSDLVARWKARLPDQISPFFPQGGQINSS